MPDDTSAAGRRPTLLDVAKRAGVSRSLASLVIRGEPMVSEDKRRRVLQAAEELGYRPNLAGRSLSTTRSRVVGVLVADMRNPFLIEVLERAEQALEAAGRATLMTGAVAPSRWTTGPRVDVNALSALKDLHVEALLIVGSVPEQGELAEIFGDIPVVVAGATAGGLAADAVRNNDELGMRLIIDYLVAAGHRHITHLGGLGGAVADERAAGYRAAMRHHGLDREIRVADADFSEDAGYRAAAQLLRQGSPVTAITAVSDLAALGALSAAADCGLVVPDDLSVTGYDDSFLAGVRQVSLTSVNPDSSGIGALAARRVLERIADPRRVPEEHLLPPRLVVRSTTRRD